MKWREKATSSLKPAKWHPLVSFSPPNIFNPWPNSSASCVVNYSQLSACQGDVQPFEGDPYTRGHLTSLRNKPQQKQPGKLSASIPG